MQKALNGMGGPQGMQNSMMMNGGQQGQGMMPMTPQQQMEFMAMMEQQTRMLAQFTGMMPAGNGFQQGQQNGQDRSLFSRIEPGRGRGGGRGRGRNGAGPNGHIKSPNKASDGDSAMEGDSQTGGDASTEGQEGGDAERKPLDPSATMCHFNLRCTNPDCAFVHQSPAAPEGTIVDMSQTCTFGPACKNVKCIAKHPSPSKVKAFQAQELCKFFPNCTKPNCPFKHPSMPLCKFGASCTTANCPFTHLETACKFNPCTNLRCPFKHEPGQQKTTNFADYSWTPEKQAAQEVANQHVSDRKFVDDQAGEEELVRPEGNEQAQAQQEMVT
jgi:nuclear polyadenylated RNA-binding protein NAB2